LNVVTTKKLGNVQTITGIDGKILPDGNVKVYNLTGTTSVFDKMITDYLQIAKNLNDVAKQKSVNKIVPLQNEKFYDNEKCFQTCVPMTELPDDEDKRFYTLLSQTFTNNDKYQLLFIEFISTPQVEQIPGAKTELTSRFDELKKNFDETYGRDKEKIKSDSEDQEFIRLKDFVLEDSTDRRLLYNTIPLNNNDSLTKDKKTQISQIYSQTNWNNQKNTFDGKVKLN
jgi:hypothetical protein